MLVLLIIRLTWIIDTNTTPSREYISSLPLGLRGLPALQEGGHDPEVRGTYHGLVSAVEA